MVIITLTTILNEEVGNHFSRWSYYFAYNKKWFHIRNKNIEEIMNIIRSSRNP